MLTKLSQAQLDALRAVPLNGMPNRVRLAFALSESQQADLVRATGLAAPNVSNIVNGRYQTVTIETARKFAAFFGCAIEDLFPAREEVA